MTRVIASVANLFFSIFLGAFALALTVIYAPDTANALMASAGGVATAMNASMREMTSSGQVQFLLDYFIDRRQILLLGFVIAVRILISLGFWAFSSMFSSARAS